MDKDKEEYLDLLPEIEYFLNAKLSSLLDGYEPPMQTKGKINVKSNDTEMLEDEFFGEIDKQLKI